MNKTPKEQAREKFMEFMVISIGGNITAPMPVLEEEIKGFKHINSLDESDAALNCLIELDKVEDYAERIEIIKILIMKVIKHNDINHMVDDLHDYSIHLLEYLKDHEEARDPDAAKNANDAMSSMFGLE